MRDDEPEAHTHTDRDVDAGQVDLSRALSFGVPSHEEAKESERVRQLEARLALVTEHMVSLEEDVRGSLVKAPTPPSFKENEDFDRQATAFRGLSQDKIEKAHAPKIVTNGRLISEVAMFNNKPSESIDEFIGELMPLLNFQDPNYWITLVDSRLSKTVRRTMREAGIQRHGPCGFTRWDEYHKYLIKRYRRSHYKVTAIQSVLFRLKQTASLEAYIGQFDSKIATTEMTLDDTTKKTILLEHMR